MSSAHSDPRVYTLGYYSRSIDEIVDFVDALNALVLDVRLKPYSSYAPDWNTDNLSFVLDARYKHAVGLGNLAGRGEPVRLHDPERWYGLIGRIIAKGKSVILLCGCRDFDSCHRAFIADHLSETGLICSHIRHGDTPADTLNNAIHGVRVSSRINDRYRQRHDIRFVEWLRKTKSASKRIVRAADYFSRWIFGDQKKSSVVAFESGSVAGWHRSDNRMTLFDFSRIVEFDPLVEEKTRHRLIADTWFAWYEYRGIKKRK